MFVRFRILFYLLSGILFQHFYAEITGNSGGGYGALIFSVATLLDPGFTVLNIRENKNNSKGKNK